MRQTEQEILTVLKTCNVPSTALSGTFYIWRHGSVARGVVALRTSDGRVIVDWMVIQPAFQWTQGAEFELLNCVKEEAQGKQIVWLTDDCDLREWLSDRGFKPARNKRRRAAMVLDARSAVAERLRKYIG